MKKLQLKLDTLRVDSFATGDAGAEGRGTVQANERGAVAFMAPTQAATCVTCTRHTDPCLCLITPAV